MVAIIGSISGLLFVSIPLFWIYMHYKSRGNKTSGFTEEESRQLEELLDAADTMAERIKTLESILDDETPDWREHHGEE